MNALRPFLTAMALLGTPFVMVPPASAVSCPHTNTSWGLGAQSAYCSYDCPAGELVEIQVASTDAVRVTGATRCGGVSASCVGDGVCRGVSESVTISRQRNATCEGHSNDIVRSPLTVRCSTKGAGGAKCLLLECEPSPPPAVKAQSDASGWSVLIQYSTDAVLGTVCDATACRPFVPVCETLGRGVRCSTP